VTSLYSVDVHEALINPGPDMIVCDEGHRIKNSHAGISQSLKNIRTR
jgi:RAD54-like protein 2